MSFSNVRQLVKILMNRNSIELKLRDNDMVTFNYRILINFWLFVNTYPYFEEL